MLRNISEIWQYRALVWALVVRHLNARYRGSLFGFLWTFLNPLCLIGIYALVFKYYIRFDHVENYTLFLFTGLLPWIWFSSALIEATSSISSGGSLITKAMFPAQILPVVAVVAGFINFVLSLPLLVLFMWISGVALTKFVLWLPLLLILQFIFLLGLGFAFSALNVLYRDVQHLIANFLTLWFFLCPIIYPATVVPDKFRFTISLNPVAIFTEGYHLSFLGEANFDTLGIVIAVSSTFIVFALGNVVFNRYRDQFAECL